MKKVLSLFLVIVLLSSFTILAYAEIDDTGTLRGPACSCGGTMYPTGTTYSSWNRAAQVSCPHSNIDHVCYLYKRSVMTTWKCNNCSYSRTDTREETKTECTLVNF